ncbi:novel immune-type receptor 8 [Xyrauchen texanus]|uniref:novel immune-type receptor 8 n=1 Tax=Xyrauchen texanus TaxID=154827 RepID=UPI00224242C9|nr:novel immune-type receptor 8 [Xyrauchen texanus]
MSKVFFLTFVCCIGAQNIRQPTSLQTTTLGDNVTIECYLPKTDFNIMVWYKQVFETTLQPISRCYNYLNIAKFFDGYNDGRFTVKVCKGIFHLNIFLTKNEDIATYFCGVITFGELKFGPGTFLMLQEEHTSTTVLQEQIVDEVNLGDNVTLMCRVNKVHEDCSRGHNAYWIRKGSEEYNSSIIYTDGDMEEHCEESSGDGPTTQSCIYSLTKRNLHIADAGTYYCAVSTCNKIMFGNGTTLEFKPQHDSNLTTALLITLVTSNIISLIIMISLVALQEALTYTSVSFTNKPRPSKGSEQQSISKHNEVYSKTKSY